MPPPKREQLSDIRDFGFFQVMKSTGEVTEPSSEEA